MEEQVLILCVRPSSSVIEHYHHDDDHDESDCHSSYSHPMPVPNMRFGEMGHESSEFLSTGVGLDAVKSLASAS